ncbi:MAG: bifunctional 4-hydroxy-3-methylbut-2-enyl diphosphate reductase/30S ribosomal protein S1 [Lachnospiraceae bacterium]|jgi:(E)-4-hydroxy-3-methyl-but-2-enyl pyrophosphate reductase|nr:bifunctional 4-hydroxy-3-methylbut-2-enyl diphosphate reductase/30S ribosomal protein S1 [Lachnospiraceae bacterium]
MEVRLAKTAGFCFGVKRAVDMVYAQIKERQDSTVPVYTYGEIIHNESVIDELQKQGVRVIKDLAELETLPKGMLILRAHGVSKAVYTKLKEMGVCYLDATCPLVARIHRLVEEHSEDPQKQIVILGDRNHPEVQGIRGWCKTEPVIFHDPEEIRQYQGNSGKKHIIVSQTTLNYKKMKDMVEILEKKRYDRIVINTICSATEQRQEEAARLAGEVDAMIVIGGKNSSNTQKLYEICIKKCVDTYYIQTLDDLDLTNFKSFRCVGITAGASTPNKIIEEVHSTMSEMSFEELLEETLVTIHNGDVVEGTVIGVKEDEIILNIGYKADGIITKNEYSNNPVDLTTVVQVGDTMEAKVLKVNDGEGQVLLTYKRLAAEKGNKRLEEAYNSKEVLTAKVAQVLNGGLSVVIDEARVFIPASLVSDVYEKNLEKYKDQEIEFVISEFNPKRRRIIGDRKQLMVARKAEMQKALFARISVGMTVEGTVKNVTDFGAFIDLGGADGLLHISEMSWGHVENPKKVFKVGDLVRAFIKDINGEKIALSLKFPELNPWTGAAEKYAIGTEVTGRVARMTDFGAFVELEPGVDALLHVSQIAKEHIDKPSDVLKTGQQVTAKIVDFNEDAKKISLSIKALLLDTPANSAEDEEEEYDEEEAASEE